LPLRPFKGRIRRLQTAVMAKDGLTQRQEDAKASGQISGPVAVWVWEIAMLTMPKPDASVLARRAQIVADLRDIVPGEGVVDATNEMRAFETDALTAYRQMPLVVVLPETVEQVSRVLRYCHRYDIRVVPRGSGTSLSGGALPLEDAVLLVMSRFNRVLEIDYPNRCVTVQPGVTNLGITHAVQDEGFYYAPDPSSQIACSIGGNIGENSGGVHSLKYGLTTNNVLGLEMVLINGDVVRLGGKHLDSEGYDLLALMTGSEGLLGVVTEVTVRILQKPETARAVLVGFPTSEEAGRCVADIIAAGIIPGGMEMMDRPAIHAAEDFVHADYPLDVEALLIVELDGPKAEVDHLLAEVEAIASKNGATTMRVSQSEEERATFWAGRKAAFPAVGRISPDYLCMDGTIPRKELPKVLAGMRDLSEKHGLRVANVFHAGDGNLHPLILYDANKPGELEAAEAFGADILRLCVAVGGVLTGEHGVGVEKRDLMPEMFNEADLDQQMRVKCAFDEKHLLNPGKVFPQLKRCAEMGRMHIHRGQMPFPDIPRF
jgi:glycolate oxidase